LHWFFVFLFVLIFCVVPCFAFWRCSFALMVLSICHVVSVVGSSHCWYWGFITLLLLLLVRCVINWLHCLWWCWFVMLLVCHIINLSCFFLPLVYCILGLLHWWFIVLVVQLIHHV
jgi:hypothetical protein